MYPPLSGGQAEADRRERFAYNAQGQERWREDHIGGVIEQDFDTGSRLTHRRATTLGSGIDSAVRRISTT